MSEQLSRFSEKDIERAVGILIAAKLAGKAESILLAENSSVLDALDEVPACSKEWASSEADGPAQALSPATAVRPTEPKTTPPHNMGSAPLPPRNPGGTPLPPYTPSSDPLPLRIQAPLTLRPQAPPRSARHWGLVLWSLLAIVVLGAASAAVALWMSSGLPEIGEVYEDQLGRDNDNLTRCAVQNARAASGDYVGKVWLTCAIPDLDAPEARIVNLVEFGNRYRRIKP